MIRNALFTSRCSIIIMINIISWLFYVKYFSTNNKLLVKYLIKCYCCYEFNPSFPKGGLYQPPPLPKFFLPYKNAWTYRQMLPYTFKFILCAYFSEKISTVPPGRGFGRNWEVRGVGATPRYLKCTFEILFEQISI